MPDDKAKCLRFCFEIYIEEGGVGNGLEGCVNEEAVTPDIRGAARFKGGNSSHPANLNRGTAIPGPNVTLYLITCRLEVTIDM